MTEYLALVVRPLALTQAMLIVAIPHLTRRDVLFGVPVPEGFRSSEAGRRAVRSYRILIAIPTLLSLLGMIFIPNSLLSVAALLSVTIVGTAAFIAQHRKLKAFAIQPPLTRELELGQTDRLPWFTWLGIPPLALLVGAAAYLRSHGDGVYGPLIQSSEIAVWTFAVGLASWYGSRRSNPMRRPALVLMLAFEWSAALFFAGIVIPNFALEFAPFLVLIPAFAYAIGECHRPHEPLDPTPNECWKGGLIYYNPNDAALFVQRRDGIGFTFNLANRWSWALNAGLLLMLASIPFLPQS